MQNYLQIHVSRFLCSKLSPLPYSCRNSTLKICLDCCEMINAVSLFAGEKYLSVQDFFFFFGWRSERVSTFHFDVRTSLAALSKLPSESWCNCHPGFRFLKEIFWCICAENKFVYYLNYLRLYRIYLSLYLLNFLHTTNETRII